MRFSTPSVSSKDGKGSSNQLSPRHRKKHKRLDAICEREYTKNHGDANENCESGIRRSSRVRRAPVLLDNSPPPPKKRRKLGNNRNAVSGGGKRVKSSPAARDSEDSGDPGIWKSRLRTRGVNKLSFRVKEERVTPRGKRRIFCESNGDAEIELGGVKVEPEVVGKYTVVKSKRPGRIKATIGSGSEAKVIDSIVVKDEETVVEELEVDDDLDKEIELQEDDDLDGPTEKEITDDDDDDDDGDDDGDEDEEDDEDEDEEQLVETEEPLQSEDECVRDDTVKMVDDPEATTEPLKDAMEELDSTEDQSDDAELVTATENGADFMDAEETEKQPEQVEMQTDVMDVVSPVKETEPKSCDNENGVKKIELDEESRGKDSDAKVESVKFPTRDILGKPRIKEGRRCGLCGGGLDGKPPKPLAQDTGESDNELYCGSSGSEDPNYDIWDGFGDEPSWLGRLLGPINDRYGIAGTWLHQHCAVWSPEVYFAGLGSLKNVRAALCRGRVLKCTRCGRPGATIGCRVDRCPKTYHLPCARANGCIFDHRKFLIACTDHRHLFQPHGLKKLAIIKKVKARKMKLELRKLANEASRKDIEAEEKWFENCGEDEEFLKRESKRLHRDVARIAPVYIGGKDSESGKLFEGWESVAGLQNVIQCMKEVVILPLLYPEFFDNLGLTPPRGVLLHGYPGTGKTLVVRALIGACARGDKRIAYFARKGADCLGKYVGDAERQLRLLFQVAEKCQPSIIFFDEIDGLAPCRTRRQDQTHSSVVSTLLALMDGLKSRGSVIVIGATNRPDAVDPALRRPGRFDREIYFPLPSLKDRAAILSLHTQKWPKQVTGPLLEWIASKTVGFAGADLQALCTQAAIIGLKRNFPLQEILSAAEEQANNGKRLPLPNFVVEERDWLEALSRSPPPCSRREAGIAASDVASSPLPCHLIPCLLRPLVTLLASLHLDDRILLPAPLSKAACMIKSVIISTMMKKNLQSDCWWSFLNDFIKEAGVAGEIKRGLLDSGILLGDDCIAAADDFNDKADDNNLNAKFKLCMKRNGTSFLQPRKASGFRVLIAGNPRSGQRHLASCLVHCFVGNGEIKKVDLATISQQGHGDVGQGITDILRECAGVSSITVFMPRLDLWAVETTQQVMEESDSVSVKDNSGLRHNHAAENKHTSGLHTRKTADKFGDQSVTRRVSSAWSLFVEQVESIRISTSLTILVTSELPCELLPIEIREFFMKRASSSQPTLVEHSIPRFVVQVDGDFDHDSVIDVSAAKLSRDIVQHLTQLLHQRSHTHKTSSEKYKVSDFFEDHTSVVNPTARCDEELVPKTLPPNARVSKGRSNLHLAISSFGYQILRYPHFAELCWVTSKLKEGPSAEVSGPWKSWPFNSCIVRSTNSLEEIVVGSRSVKVKSKEKSGLVKGLIAVGLSAYKGVYSSLREVSFEVRKVLELLVTQVNEKVKAGKDRYQYIRLLSQVAYLEDKVNSWVYSLQSLEIDAPVTVDNAKINGDNAPKSTVQSGEGKPYATSQLNESTELGDKKVLPIDLNKEDGDLSHFNSDGSQQIVVSAENSVPEQVGNSEHNNQPAEKILTKQNGRHLGPPLSENNVYHSRVNQDSVVLEHSNGFASGVVSEDGPRPDSNSNLNEPSSEETESDDVCLYRCCSECLKGLLGLTKKVLIRRCKLDRSRLTVDDVHDVVASLSVDLVSAVRKVYIDGKANSPADTKQRTCQCDDSQNGIFAPVDCGCHSESSLSNRSQAEMGFLFRNGMLVRFDPGTGVSSFHCRFEALCLCSLIDSIQTSVQRDS